MKQIYILTTILFLTCINLNAQTTFGYETAVDNGGNLTETVNGITLTTSSSNIQIMGGPGNYIADAFIISSSDVVTFTFSQPVNVNSILFTDPANANYPWDYTFTPLSGPNLPITIQVNSADLQQVNLNWIGITSFTVYGPTNGEMGVLDFDNLVVNSPALSVNDYALKTFKVLPNPSSDFIKINGLNTKESYSIYTTLGKEVKKGIAVENEKIDIQNLKNGLYFLKFKQGNTVKFLKE